MKTFKRAKTIEELKALCEEKGFLINTDQYDAGGDWVTILFATGGKSYEFLFSGFNGRFIGKLEDGTMFTESSTEFEDQDWYNEILDFLYVPETQAAQ